MKYILIKKKESMTSDQYHFNKVYAYIAHLTQ